MHMNNGWRIHIVTILPPANCLTFLCYHRFRNCSLGGCQLSHAQSPSNCSGCYAVDYAEMRLYVLCPDGSIHVTFYCIIMSYS